MFKKMNRYVCFVMCIFVVVACSNSPKTYVSVASNSTKLQDLYGGSPAQNKKHYKIGKPYRIKGKLYYPKKDANYDEIGIASWYGPKFHNKLTANGEIFNQNAYTAAHRTLPMPSIVKVTNLENGRSLLLRVNDRGPFAGGDRIIDLSKIAAEKLGFKKKGLAKVRVQINNIETAKLFDANLRSSKNSHNKDIYSQLPALSKIAESYHHNHNKHRDNNNSNRFNNIAPYALSAISNLANLPNSANKGNWLEEQMVKQVVKETIASYAKQIAVNQATNQAVNQVEGAISSLDGKSSMGYGKTTFTDNTNTNINGNSASDAILQGKYDAKPQYLIRIASFSSYENALNKLRSLPSIPKLHIYEEMQANNNYYRLVAGGFNNENEAERILQIIQASGIQDAFITAGK